jgi:GT2 family glycosyltransferase
MSAPVVSVVLPAYNAADTVAETISSILGQTLRNFELIVVEDGSTDTTASVLEKFDDRRLVVVRHPENRGFGAALRTGVAATTTDIIARIDADDVAHPARLEREYDMLLRRPEVGLVTTAYFIVDELGNEIEQRHTPPDHASAWFRLLFGNQFGHSTAMFRRSVYDEVGGYRNDYYPSEDHDLWLLMAEAAEIAMIPDPLLWYKQLDSSMSATMTDKMEAASIGASAAALERITGVRPPERILHGFRHHFELGCDDAEAVLDVALPAYAAVAARCRARGISTQSLRGELGVRLARGGFVTPDGKWCTRGLVHLFVRQPWLALGIVSDRVSRRLRRRRS